MGSERYGRGWLGWDGDGEGMGWGFRTAERRRSASLGSHRREAAVP